MELLHQTWPWRVAIGIGLLATLAVVDLIRRPGTYNRLKEYGFLFGVTGLAVAYGLLHDRVTWAISPEYFAVGKGLGESGFFPDVATLAAKASWTVGLAVGLVLLVANNPSVKLPQLPYRRLVRFLFRPLMYSVIAASTFGALAGAGVEQLREWLGVDLGDPVADTRFVIVWGIHVGTYVGVALGLVDAVIGIRRERITMAALTIEASAPPTT